MKLQKLHKAGKQGIAVFSALLLFLTGMFALQACTKPENSPVPEPDSSTSSLTEPVASGLNPLTGLALNDAQALGKRPYVFMINNAPAARPQWGLCAADIVLESMVEGGITRMLWMFADSKDAPKVGPVRSARHDFVEIAEGLDAIFVHWGGSPQAYKAIKNRNVNHIDGMSYSGKYFMRDKIRKTAIEHRGYTQGDLIAKATSKLQLRTESRDGYQSPFRFTAAPRTPGGGKAITVSYQFSSAFKYKYEYRESENLYYQTLNGTPFTQDGGKQRAVTNIVLLYVKVGPIPGDKKGRVEIQLTSGDGVYISNGSQEPITWKKGDPADPLKLYAADGSALLMNAGKGYIGLIPDAQRGKAVIV